MMKRFLSIAAVAAVCALSASAQIRSAEDYLRRYGELTARVGLDGAGVGSLISRWEADYPDDVSMLEAKFVYYYSSSRSSQVIRLDKDRYLGNEPVLSLKDSLDNPINYFEDYIYDDEKFGLADAAIEKAIRLAPDRLDLRFSRISTMMSFEKESPDMALAALKQLIDYNYISKPKWTYSGESVDNSDFCQYMQDFCVAFYHIGSPSSREAFREISEKMSKYNPKNTSFMDNLGSYSMLKKDNKTALKYFNKVLKLSPSDMTALKNCILIARSSKDVKMEKKYLAMMARNGETEIDRKGAEMRLESLGAKK